jgi:hypothetical protein
MWKGKSWSRRKKIRIAEGKTREKRSLVHLHNEPSQLRYEDLPP